MYQMSNCNVQYPINAHLLEMALITQRIKEKKGNKHNQIKLNLYQPNLNKFSINDVV